MEQKKRATGAAPVIPTAKVGQIFGTANVFSRFMRRCFANHADMFSNLCRQVLQPTVMGRTTHNCELYDPQLWVIQPITVGSKTSAHVLENLCLQPGKHPQEKGRSRQGISSLLRCCTHLHSLIKLKT